MFFLYIYINIWISICMCKSYVKENSNVSTENTVIPYNYMYVFYIIEKCAFIINFEFSFLSRINHINKFMSTVQLQMIPYWHFLWLDLHLIHLSQLFCILFFPSEIIFTNDKHTLKLTWCFHLFLHSLR